jgi:rfaE bifunctional protein nucleotidyltransferase chain/domain
MGILTTLDTLVNNILWRRNSIVGFTCGVFDILHIGHVRYLKAAKAKVDVLVVAVNSDESVRANKGPDRPIITALDRAKLIASLECVDWVLIFNDQRPNKIIEQLKPDYYIKGGDYTKDQLKSAPLVESYGGKVLIIPKIDSLSTTEIIERIKNVYSKRET